jgi:hypothetical protein
VNHGNNRVYIDAEYNRAFVFSQYAGLPAARFGYWRISVLAGPGQQRATARRSETARNGMFVQYLGGISATFWTMRDAVESRLLSINPLRVFA